MRALDGVTVDLPAGEFTAVMGPSGSGKSTLMHCCAASTTATSGPVFIGDTELTGLVDKELTRLRRERIGFVFQSFNLVPTLTARREHHAAAVDRRPQARPRVVRHRHRDRRASATGSTTGPTSCPAASSSGSPWPARWSAGRASSSPTSRPATSTPRSGAEVLTLLRPSVDELGQTIVMVTHDPVAASYTDRVRLPRRRPIVDELRDPDREQVLNKMQELAPASPPRPARHLTCGA